ncbi:MAG: IS66-like element accessory protein TnpA [Alkalilacustris sp.]
MADGDVGFGRLEVMSGPTGRRRWPDEVKARIVAESFLPGARVGDVARRHDVVPSQLTTWRRLAREGRLALPWDFLGEPEPGFVPLVVEDATEDRGVPPAAASRGGSAAAPVIEVVVGDVTVRLSGDVAVARLAALVTALSGARR